MGGGHHRVYQHLCNGANIGARADRVDFRQRRGARNRVYCLCSDLIRGSLAGLVAKAFSRAKPLARLREQVRHNVPLSNTPQPINECGHGLGVNAAAVVG